MFVINETHEIVLGKHLWKTQSEPLTLDVAGGLPRILLDLQFEPKLLTK